MSQQRYDLIFWNFQPNSVGLVTAEVLRRPRSQSSFLLRTVRDFRKSFRGRFYSNRPEEQLQWMEQLRMRLLDMAGNEPLAGYFTEIRDRGLDFPKGHAEARACIRSSSAVSSVQPRATRSMAIHQTVKRSARDGSEKPHTAVQGASGSFERVSASWISPKMCTL